MTTKNVAALPIGIATGSPKERPTHPIPAAALDDRLGILGMTGSGKTFGAGTCVERILAQRGRVIILDPLGVWWGLRQMADAKLPSPYEIVISTYDSSRAPKRGEAHRRVDLSPLNVAALKERLASVEAEIKANDPKALRGEITRLKAELTKAAKNNQHPQSTPIDRRPSKLPKSAAGMPVSQRPAKL
jgi:uncharacterized small protein (DUF1192 family)